MAVAKAYLPPVSEEKAEKFIEGLNKSVIDWDYIKKSRKENTDIKIKINVEGL